MRANSSNLTRPVAQIRVSDYFIERNGSLFTCHHQMCQKDESYDIMKKNAELLNERKRKNDIDRSINKQEDGGCRACAWIGACMARKRRMHACALEPRDVRRPESLLPCLWLWGCVRDWLGWVALTCRHIEIVFSFFSFFLCVAWWVGAATAKAAQTEVPVAPLAGRVIIDWISTVWSRERKKYIFI